MSRRFECVGHPFDVRPPFSRRALPCLSPAAFANASKKFLAPLNLPALPRISGLFLFAAFMCFVDRGARNDSSLSLPPPVPLRDHDGLHRDLHRPLGGGSANHSISS